jgi:hypothetical protein
MSGMCQGCTSLTAFTTPLNTSNAIIMDYMFANCTSLVSVTLDVSKMATGNTIFSGCTALTNCYLMNLNKSITLSGSPNLTRESVLFMVDNSTGTGFILLHATARKRLTDADVDYIHLKGWSLSPAVNEEETELQTVLYQKEKEKNKNLIRKIKDFFLR